MKRGRAYRSAVLVGLLVLAAPAGAHVPQLRGRLIDLATQSDVIVFGTVERSTHAAPHGTATTIRVDRWLTGAAAEETLAFDGGPRVAPGQRYLFFLRHADGGLSCLQPSGTVFASRPEDDRAYADAVAAIRAANASQDAVRAVGLRTAMIAALAAPAAGLRFHAVLELAALAHDGFPERERRALERILADPGTDPAIRPAVTSLLATADTPR